MSISKLKVDNHDVLISREIEQAPLKTMVRELVQNGFEAGREYKDQTKTVEFYAKNVELEDGQIVKKLAIKNNGIGMTSNELYKSTNLSASIRKTMGKTNNYGIGAKVSGLRSNPEGMCYRSCNSGIVSEVTLMKEGDAYGRLKDDETNEDIINVTNEYSANELLEDWTEVVLYGHDILDNTITKPFGDEFEVPENWLNLLVNNRYYRFPTNTQVIYHEGILSAAQNRRTLKSWEELITLKDTIKSEIVDSGDGYRVNYVLNKADGWNVHRHSAKSTGALVYKDEMFDVASGNTGKLIGKTWGSTAPKLGIPFGSRDICIFIELNDDYPVEMNNYRNEIQDSTGEKVCIEDFGGAVASLMPDWVKEYIDKERNKHNGSNNSMKRRIADLIKNLSLTQNQLKPQSGGNADVVLGHGVQGLEGKNPSKGTKKKRLLVAKKGGNTSADVSKGLQDMPDWAFITDKSEINANELNGYCASYVSEGNMIYINANHHVFTQKKAELENEFADVMMHETGKDVVIEKFQDEYAFNIIASVIFARSEWKQNRWDKEMLDDATSKPALTISLAKDFGMISRVKMALGNNSELKSIKMVVNNV